MSDDGPESTKRTGDRALLVTLLGTNPKWGRYTLENRCIEAQLAPVALVQLLTVEQRPSRIVALCTKEAIAESLPLLVNGVDGTGVDVEHVELGDDPTDVGTFLQIVSQALPSESQIGSLMIDATHGFRHFAVLTYLAIQYLSALRGIQVRNAFYGLWRPIDEGASPFLDLRSLLVLPEWIHALRVFDEAGDASQLARLIVSDHDQTARTMAKELQQISEARETGLPLELGQGSASFHAERKKPFKKVVRAHGALLEDELWQLLDASLERFGFAAKIQAQAWKRQVTLTVNELARQAALVDDLLDRGSIAVALGLMNEWIVSRVVLQVGRPDEWLDYHSARRSAATALGALDEIGRDSDLGSHLSDAQRSLGRFWHDVSDLRNAFHHHGMRPQVLVGSGANDLNSKLGAVRDYWNLLKTVPEVALPFPVAWDRLLVSPVGRSPGVLYSAVEACRRDGQVPDACLLLVSEDTSSTADQALHHAGFEGDVHRLQVADPYGGRSEIEVLVRNARSKLVLAQEVVVNLTGGTTVMGLAVAAMAEEARRLARDVRRFGLADRRQHTEQDADPYRAGEAFWLEPRRIDGD